MYSNNALVYFSEQGDSSVIHHLSPRDGRFRKAIFEGLEILFYLPIFISPLDFPMVVFPMRCGVHEPFIDTSRHIEILIYPSSVELDFQSLTTRIISHTPKIA